MSKSLQIFCALVWSGLAPGCGSSGPELASVSGTVKVDGTPLADAFIKFVPASGRARFNESETRSRTEQVESRAAG